jgi:uncharacterized membrane protein
LAVIFLSEIPRTKKVSSAFFRQRLPPDLILVVVWLAASIVAIYLPYLNATWVRFILALPVILFIPGYCLIAALFPKESDIDLMERCALSFGISVAVVPLIGFGLNFTPWGIRLDPIVISLTLFTLVMVLIAFYKRARLPLNEQFRIPFSEIAGTIRNGIFPHKGNRVDQLLAVTLLLIVVIAIITTIYVFTVPKEGEHYSDFFVLGENRTVANYPFLLNTSQNYPIYIGIGNHEYRDTNYTIETWIQRTEFNNVTNTTQILVMEPNDRLQLTLSHNETKIIPYNLSVKKTGYTRVEFLLFKENVPGFEVTGSDRINASYRNLHLWVTIEDGLNLEDSNYILI